DAVARDAAVRGEGEGPGELRGGGGGPGGGRAAGELFAGAAGDEGGSAGGAAVRMRGVRRRGFAAAGVRRPLRGWELGARSQEGPLRGRRGALRARWRMCGDIAWVM